MNLEPTRVMAVEPIHPQKRITLIRGLNILMTMLLVAIVIYQFIPLNPLTFPKRKSDKAVLHVLNPGKQVRAGEILKLKGTYCKNHPVSALYSDQLLNGHIIALVPEGYEDVPTQDTDDSGKFQVDNGVIKAVSNVPTGCKTLRINAKIPAGTYPDTYIFQRNIEYLYPLRYNLPVIMQSESFKVIK